MDLCTPCSLFCLGPSIALCHLFAPVGVERIEFGLLLSEVREGLGGVRDVFVGSRAGGVWEGDGVVGDWV